MNGLALCMALTLFFLESSALGAQRAAAPSPYTPPGLYDVEQLRLANGFRVILKQRNGTPNVSLRLAVNVGARHFTCSGRETPHLIEHLLFSGTAPKFQNFCAPITASCTFPPTSGSKMPTG